MMEKINNFPGNLKIKMGIRAGRKFALFPGSATIKYF